jgi:ADP-ribose pyrophosphatase YjhB (NUDIX family)
MIPTSYASPRWTEAERGVTLARPMTLRVKPRLAVRALILHQDRLLLVNAWPEGQSDLWCAPGGGVEANTSLPENLRREVMEETGLTIAVGPPVLVNEFHDPDVRFHQVDIYFRCTITGGDPHADWTDPEGVVTRRRFFARAEMAAIRFKPDSLPGAAWDGVARDDALLYDPLEPILR